MPFLKNKTYTCYYWALLMLCDVTQTSSSIGEARSAGVRVRLGHKGVHFVNAIEAGLANRALSSLYISEIAHNFNEEKFVKFTNIRATGVDPPTYSQQLLAPDTIIKAFEEGKVKLEGLWSVNVDMPLFGTMVRNGHFSGEIENRFSSAILKIGSSSVDFRPMVELVNCSAKLSLFHFHFGNESESLAVLANHLLNHRFLNSVIREQVASLLCQQAKAFVETVSNQLFQTLPTKLRIGPVVPLLLDYSWVASMTIENNGLVTSHRGEVLVSGTNCCESTSVMEPASLPELEATEEKMLYVQASDFVLNSLMVAVYQLSLIRFTFNNENVGEYIARSLDTTCPGRICMSYLSYELGKRYPNESVELELLAASAPTFWFHPKGIQLNFTGVINTYVKPNQNSATHRQFLFASEFLAKFSVVPKLRQHKDSSSLAGNCSIESVVINIKNSTLPDMDREDLQEVVDLLLLSYKKDIERWIDEKLYIELSLPLPGNMSLLNPELVLQDRAILIKTDLSCNS